MENRDYINWEEVQMLLDDDEVLVAVLEEQLNLIAAVIDEEFLRDVHASWQNIRVHVEDWQTLEDPAFRKHFRMSRAVFNKLHDVLRDHLIEKGRYHRRRTDFDLCLMMGLWILLNMDTFKNVALLFNTSPGVVFFHYVYIIEALRELCPIYITWPSPDERQVIKTEFYAKGGYPGVIGCIDGMHTFITAPLVEHQAYINRHQNHSILSQAVVDHNMLIRDLYVGEPGSLHDSRVFRRSPLSRNLLENPALLGEDEHIIGDGAYILTDKVLIPYADNGNLNEAQRFHNRTLSAVRSHVERAFCFTKMKCPRLKYFRSLRVEYAVDHIVSAFVLHNFITLEGEEAPQFDHPPPPPMQHGGRRGHCNEDDPDDPAPLNIPQEDLCCGEFPDVAAEPDHPLMAVARMRGEEKREIIAARLFEERLMHEEDD